MRRYVVLFVLGVLATLPYWGCYQDMDDEAVSVLGITRLLAGEIPYRDWTTRHTPGSYFLSLPFFFLFGNGALATRAWMAVVSSLTGMTLQAASEQFLTGRLRYLPWLVWTCTGLLDKPQLNYHWFGCLFSCVTLWLILLWVKSPQPNRLPYAVGLVAALSSWMIQSNGASSWLMIVLVWLRLRPPGLLKVIGAYLVTQLLLWLPWAAFWPQVWENHVDILGRHLQFNRQPYSWRYLGDLFRGYQNLDWGRQPVLALSAWSYLGHQCLQYGLFYLAIFVHLGVAEWRRDRVRRALAYACLAWAVTTGYCQTIGYLAYAAPAFWLTAAALVPVSGRWLAYLWMALELAGWGLRAGSMAEVFRYPCVTRAGSYWCANELEAQELRTLHAFVEEHCPPQSQVLAYPYLTRLYTTENLKNPIADPILLPWLWSDKAFQDCKQRLAQQRVPYLFYRPLSGEAIHSDYPSVPAQEFEVAAERAWSSISQDYEPVWQGQIFQIWRRR